MGIRCNRHIVHDNIKYNMFCNDPMWDISSYGYNYLLTQGFHPDTNPWVLDCWEEYLLKYGFLKCIAIPSKESKYDQLNYESLYVHSLG